MATINPQTNRWYAVRFTDEGKDGGDDERPKRNQPGKAHYKTALDTKTKGRKGSGGIKCNRCTLHHRVCDLKDKNPCTECRNARQDCSYNESTHKYKNTTRAELTQRLLETEESLQQMEQFCEHRKVIQEEIPGLSPEELRFALRLFYQTRELFHGGQPPQGAMDKDEESDDGAGSGEVKGDGKGDKIEE